MNLEEFRDIPGFPGYLAGNMGTILSGRGARKVLIGGKNKKGYRHVALSREGKRYTIDVHRLVLITFVGPAPDGMEACHNDGNNQNNTVGNLRWDTQEANYMDKVKHGTCVNPPRKKSKYRIYSQFGESGGGRRYA